MFRGVVHLCAGRGYLGRGLSTLREGLTLGKGEGTGGHHGSGVPPVSSYVTFRTWDPGRAGQIVGPLGEGGKLARWSLSSPGRCMDAEVALLR